MNAAVVCAILESVSGLEPILKAYDVSQEMRWSLGKTSRNNGHRAMNFIQLIDRLERGLPEISSLVNGVVIRGERP